MTLLRGGTPVRFFYIDDSGSVDTGLIVYAWIELTADEWRAGLRTWLDLRKDLYRNHSVPPSEELHATKFVNGRDRISLDPAVNRSKSRLRQIMTEALQVIRIAPELRLGIVYRKTKASGAAYAKERNDVYQELLAHLDTRLTAANEFGLVFMDGDGTDPHYQRAHRRLKLEHRRIIEDPLFQGAHQSQWIQMADLVAWTTYQSLLLHPGKRFAWDWYAIYLQPSDVNGGPLSV